MQMLDEKMKSLNVKLSGRVLRKIVPDIRKQQQGGAVQQDRSRHHRRSTGPRQSPESKLQKQDTQVLDPFHPTEEGGRGRATTRQLSTTRAKSAPAEAAHPAKEQPETPQFEIAECCKPIPGDKVVGLPRPRKLGQHHRPQGHVRRAEPSCDPVRPEHRQGGDQMVAAQGDVVPGDHRNCAASTGMGILLDLAKVVSADFSINIREVEHPQPRRHLRRQHQSLCQGRRGPAGRDDETA